MSAPLFCLNLSEVSKLLASAHFGLLSGADGQGVLPAGEADFRNCCLAAGVLDDCGVVTVSFVEGDDFCRGLRHFFLAVHEAYFDVRSCAVPTHLILTRGELLAVDLERFP